MAEILRFDRFEEKSGDALLYYAFDWDDNILYMPTVIKMENLIDGDWTPVDVSTAEFAEVRTDTENWRLLNMSPVDAFCEFRDNGPRGESAFLIDTKAAISANKFGPSWEDFIECLSNGAIFAIITARGHESESMKEGVKWIIDNVLTEEQLFSMYNNLIKFSYLFGTLDEDFPRILKGNPSDNELIKRYLDSCHFVGVSAPSRGGSPSNPEKAKEDALMEFKQKVNDYAKRIGRVAKIGFSDDDLKNVKHIEDLVDNLHHEQFSNIIEIIVKGTKDPENITKKIRGFGSEEQPFTETSHQTPGLESSVLTLTQFGNQSSRLNPSDSINRQDDFYNQFKRQTEYLAKISKDAKKEIKKKSSK